MGGSTFANTGRGKTAKEAFRAVVDEAQYESGHGSYTGTIAEKHDFVMISEPSEAQKRELLKKEVEYAGNSVKRAQEEEASWLAKAKAPTRYCSEADCLRFAKDKHAQVEKAQERLRALEARLASPDPVPFTRELAHAYSDYLIDKGDRRIDDKWGPAGCICLKKPEGTTPGEWLFFGWASS